VGKRIRTKNKETTMSNHNTLFNNLMHFVYKSGIRFHDLRTLTTFVWALVGLLVSETIHLNQWALHRPGLAKAASKERQLSRWLHNERIVPAVVYRPMLARVIAEWAGETLYLALDTSQLWKRFVIVRLALVYRGRALPLGWVVQASGSAMVAVACYQRMLAEVAELIPATSHVVLLADRGFMDVKLMQLARQLNWRFRIRVKHSVYVYRATCGRQSVRALLPPPGQARFFSHIWLTEQRCGPLHLALAYVQTEQGYQPWAIVSDEPVSLKTFDEYGLRFDIEENFLDDKSAGFQLESSHLADSQSISRLCLLLATATLYLVSTGTALVEMGRRHLVDTHWRRGLSYLQLGWRWLKRAAAGNDRLLDFLWLTPGPDPEPAMASWRRFCRTDLRLRCIESL
jgi:hypothetical protein